VSLFRRGEPLHVRLAREGGLRLGGEPRPGPPWDTAGIHGLHRLRQWDAVRTVVAPELEGERARFVAIGGADGARRLIVEEGSGPLEPLAASLDQELSRPYRAEAVRRDGALWAVAARAIQVRELPGLAGEEIEVALHGDERTLTVDGLPGFGSVPALEVPGHVVLAGRLEGDLWEVAVEPL
jgi:hypothetical protein